MIHRDEAELLAEELSISQKQARAAIDLLDTDATVPFIARYRKDETGGLNDEILRDLESRLEYVRKLYKRCDEIEQSILEQGKMTPEILTALEHATTLQDCETIYAPFKRKKTTRAGKAREKGLEGLSAFLMGHSDSEINEEANRYINPEKEVLSVNDAIKGAQDIFAEELSEDLSLRKELKSLLLQHALIKSSAAKDFREETTEFLNYYDYQEPLTKIPDHRILAINRGEKRKVLTVGISPLSEEAYGIIEKALPAPLSQTLKDALQDAYKRLIFPSLEREIRTDLKERAEGSCIRNFAINLKELLLQFPFKGKTTLGFDPGFRNGCKIAVLDKYGTYLDSAIIKPPFCGSKTDRAEKELLRLIDKHKVELIAIGNGTASRESERFIADVLKRNPREVQFMIVNEAGASIYSASKLAAEEYPDLDSTIRGAISIAGRLQDPLSELIKIEPQHIGVGQYQHDVNQKELTKVLNHAVEDAVNKVGADLNRSSAVLLSHIAGITPAIAKNIVSYREENGGFKNKTELKKVKGVGEKAFEQSAGFLKVSDAQNVLDRTCIHPESYPAARRLIDGLKIQDGDLIEQKPEAVELLCRLNIAKISKVLNMGTLTIIDILNELKHPGADPRANKKPPELRSDVLSLDDLEIGMELTGTVRNVVDFGAFVDIGVHQDGLIHISQFGNKFVKHPSQVVSIGDIVTVKVVEADPKRGRIGLSMLSKA